MLKLEVAKIGSLGSLEDSSYVIYLAEASIKDDSVVVDTRWLKMSASDSSAHH